MQPLPLKPVSKGLFRGLGFWFKWGIFGLFLAILLISAISKGIEQRSFKPVIVDIGGRFTGMTQELQSESLKIIENKGVYQRSERFWGGVWDFLKTYGKFLFLFYGIYLWIKILSWLIGHSWFSDTSRSFINWSLGLFIFIALQMLFLLVLHDPLDGQTKWDLLMTPITAFVDFVRAIPYMISPLSEIAETFVDNGNCTENCSV